MSKSFTVTIITNLETDARALEIGGGNKSAGYRLAVNTFFGESLKRRADEPETLEHLQSELSYARQNLAGIQHDDTYGLKAARSIVTSAAKKLETFKVKNRSATPRPPQPVQPPQPPSVAPTRIDDPAEIAVLNGAYERLQKFAFN